MRMKSLASALCLAAVPAALSAQVTRAPGSLDTVDVYPVPLTPGCLQPDHSEILRRPGIPGRVIVRFVVDTSGRVDSSSIRLVSSTQPLLEAPAREALSTCRYRPGQRAGRTVRVLLEAWVRFTRPTLPLYSFVPAPADVDLGSSVLQVVLPNIVSPRRPIALAPDAAPFGPALASVEDEMPSYWSDSLRHEVEDALGDPAMQQAAQKEQVAQVLTQLGSRTVPYQPSVLPTSDTSAVILFISRPGFNRDSTIAAVRTELQCGNLCGSGQVLLLSRRPGYRWRVWCSFALWIS
jgi:TonB family protein